VVIHYEEALYQVYTCTFTFSIYEVRYMLHDDDHYYYYYDYNYYQYE